MTTNCPWTLDSALIRPGRVDLQIGFTLATHSQIYEMFKRTYNTEADFVKSESMERGETAGTQHPEASQADMHDTISFNIRPYKPNLTELPRDELEDMAKKFADKLHAGVFSPAEIQGYLLERKTDPVRALRELEEWVSESLSGRNIE
jgi:chaperone BCS1